MKAWVCGCGEVADPNNRDGSWRFSGGTLVEHVHDGIRWSAREVEVVPAEMTREGWRPRLADVERKIATAQEWLRKRERYDADQADLLIDEARQEVRAMLDGTTGGAEPWQKRLAVVEAKLEDAHRDADVMSMWFSVERIAEVRAELRALIEL